MSPEGSWRPAGVVFQPLTSNVLLPSWPGTVISCPETGCFILKLSAARHVPTARIARITTDARRFMKSSPRSEAQTKGKLDDAGVARGGDAPERGARKAGVRVAVVRAVEEVEGLGPHVRGEAVESESLDQADIGRQSSGSPGGRPGGVARCVHGRHAVGGDVEE